MVNIKNSMKNVYVLCCHYTNERILKLYEQLQGDFGVECVYMLLDVSNIDTINNMKNLILFSNDIAKAIDPFIDKFNMPGMGHRIEAKMVYCNYVISQELDFKYMWFIEYDVFCKGSFKSVLSPCEEIESDLLAKGSDTTSEVMTFDNRKNWCWWNDIFGELGAVPIELRIGCFLPIVRVSKELLYLLKDNLGKSTGFCEVYIPTLCCACGLKYEVIPSYVFGKFQYRPVIFFDDVINTSEENKLYHPVK